MIISVPNSWNLSQRSLFSKWHSTLSNSSQLHFGLRASAYGLGPWVELLLFLVADGVDGDGDGEGEWHGDEPDLLSAELAVEHREWTDPSNDGEELLGLNIGDPLLWCPESVWIWRFVSEPGERGGEYDLYDGLLISDLIVHSKAFVGDITFDPWKKY